jgi:hypothetical protein
MTDLQRYRVLGPQGEVEFDPDANGPWVRATDATSAIAKERAARVDADARVEALQKGHLAILDRIVAWRTNEQAGYVDALRVLRETEHALEVLRGAHV